MDERAGRTPGASAGSFVAGLAISGLMIARGLQSGQPSDLIAWERAGADRLGLSTPSTKAMPGLAEQSGVLAAHLTLSAIATDWQWLPSQPRSTRMKAIQAHPQQGLDGLTLVDLPDPGDPGANAIRVRVHATSLNFHDLGVVTGRLPAADGRIPMADGGGVVEAVGSEVTEFRPGDHVVSTFFPTWLDGEATLADFATTPGDGVDGFAREVVVAPALSD